jgi:hypothetical protein
MEELMKLNLKKSTVTWKKPDDDMAINGSSLKSTMDVSYARLVEVLGPPNDEGDGYKVDAEWVLEFTDGLIATIYNYKTGRNYLGEEGLPVEQIRDWHIGGHDSRVVERVNSLIKEN